MIFFLFGCDLISKSGGPPIPPLSTLSPRSNSRTESRPLPVGVAERLSLSFLRSIVIHKEWLFRHTIEMECVCWHCYSKEVERELLLVFPKKWYTLQYIATYFWHVPLIYLRHWNGSETQWVKIPNALVLAKSWQQKQIAHLVNLPVSSISNNFNELKDSGWVLYSTAENEKWKWWAFRWLTLEP